jgi:outer membrane protein OmpA-like peptidoglycan-associated protein
MSLGPFSFARWFACGWVLAVAATAATAQAQDARVGEMSAQRFQPAPGPDNFITVERARVPDSTAVSAAVVFDYSRDPFRLRHCTPTSCSDPGATIDRVNVIRDMASAQVLAALTVLPRIELGLRLPVLYAAGDGVVTDRTDPAFGGPKPGGLSAASIGDPTLQLKVRALGSPTSVFAAGLLAAVSAPLGHALADGSYLGDSSPTLGLRAIADAKFGPFAIGVNAGALFRKQAELGTLSLGSEMRGGVGASLDTSRATKIIAEAFASTNFTTSAGTNAAEVDGAFQLAPPRSPLMVFVGGGAGLNEGLGAPLFRVFGGIGAYFEKEKAAVDRDPDRDGVLDPDDKCPHEGGDVVRLPGPYLGCPKRDSDEDGVLDHIDACPTTPGVATQDPATNGCPPADRDKDGIPNDLDKCPDEPETRNGYQDEDGCPDKAPVVVEVQKDQIVVINDRVNFEFNSDRIEGERSFEALDAVAELMNSHPEIRRIEVAGHTDNVGPRDENLSLSKRRAAQVAAYLTGKGVARARVTSEGYGPDQPVGDNATPEGRARNRRVQFNILVLAK